MICNGVNEHLPCTQKGIPLQLTVVMHCSTTNIVLNDHMIKSMRFCNGTAQSVQAVKWQPTGHTLCVKHSAWTRHFYLHHHVQTNFRDHSASYQVGI